MVKILVMGLPGSGKTFLAGALKQSLESVKRGKEVPLSKIDTDSFITYWKPKVEWFNADEVRKKFNDWDFSREGRIRQSLRMFQFAAASTADFVICDFIAPLPEMRENFKPDWIIWLDTLDESEYEDTNKMFVPPDRYDFRITTKDCKKWAEIISKAIINDIRRPLFDWKKPTVQMLGRWQPWHAGHRAVFERAIAKTGQVCIMIRDCQGVGDNPFNVEKVKNFIRKDLDPDYQGKYEIIVVPNIVNITYGRDVGYKIEQEVFDDETHAISATNIRRMMGL
jgi:adenylylsulfate kinase